MLEQLLVKGVENLPNFYEIFSGVKVASPLEVEVDLALPLGDFMRSLTPRSGNLGVAAIKGVFGGEGDFDAARRVMYLPVPELAPLPWRDS